MKILIVILNLTYLDKERSDDSRERRGVLNIMIGFTEEEKSGTRM